MVSSILRAIQLEPSKGFLFQRRRMQAVSVLTQSMLSDPSEVDRHDPYSSRIRSGPELQAARRACLSFVYLPFPR